MQPGQVCTRVHLSYQAYGFEGYANAESYGNTPMLGTIAAVGLLAQNSEVITEPAPITDRNDVDWMAWDVMTWEVVPHFNEFPISGGGTEVFNGWSWTTSPAASRLDVKSQRGNYRSDGGTVDLCLAAELNPGSNTHFLAMGFIGAVSMYILDAL